MALEDITNRPRFARPEPKKAGNAFKPRFTTVKSPIRKPPKFNGAKKSPPLKVRFKPTKPQICFEPQLPSKGGPLASLIKARTAELNALRVNETELAPESKEWNKFCDLGDGKVILCGNMGRTNKVAKYTEGVYIYV